MVLVRRGIFFPEDNYILLGLGKEEIFMPGTEVPRYIEQKF